MVLGNSVETSELGNDEEMTYEDTEVAGGEVLSRYDRQISAA
jgi:hypothetical protein